MVAPVSQNCWWLAKFVGPKTAGGPPSTEYSTLTSARSSTQMSALKCTSARPAFEPLLTLTFKLESGTSVADADMVCCGFPGGNRHLTCPGGIAYAAVVRDMARPSPPTVAARWYDFCMMTAVLTFPSSFGCYGSGARPKANFHLFAN